MSEETVVNADSTPAEEPAVIAVDDTGQVDKPGEVQGLIRELQSERQNSSNLQKQVELYESMVSNQEDSDPEEFITKGDVKEYFQKELGKYSDKRRQSDLSGQVEAAKGKYSDYDEVINYADEIAASNPGSDKVIMAMENPAEFAYKLGQTHSKYGAKANKSAVSKAADKIASNLNRANTLTDASGSSTGAKGELDEVQNMSGSDVEDALRKLKGF